MSAAKQNPHRPGLAPTLGLRAGGDGLAIVPQTASQNRRHVMWFTAMLRSVKRRRGGAPKNGRNGYRKSRSFVPRLEILDDRTLLSTLTVLNNLDSGAGSLRDAIQRAGDGDTIAFERNLAGQAITLTSDQLTITKSLTIQGPGADLLAVSGNDANRVFTIKNGVSVTIAGLTITHGQAVGTNGGGGILNDGAALTLVSTIFSSNRHIGSNADGQSMGGGAIYNRDGAVLTVRASSFLGNESIGRGGSFGEGGAIWNQASATITECTFAGNRAVGGDGGRVTGGARIIGVANGGAIFNQTDAAHLTVVNTIFRGNEAIGGNGGSGGNGASSYFVGIGTGGGISNGDHATLVVSGCTFSDNRAIGGSNITGGANGQARVGNAHGGGLANIAGSSATVTNSTFDHNEALGGSNNGGGGGVIIFSRGAGGAIANVNTAAISTDPSTLTVSGSTFTDNRAVGGAGGSAGSVVGPGAGGGIANLFGAVTRVAGSFFECNEASGGAGTGGGNGGDGLGGGIYNDGRSTLEARGSTIIDNQASGGAAEDGASAGSGVGGGLYLEPGGTACLDEFTIAHLFGNEASTSDDDVYGAYTICD